MQQRSDQGDPDRRERRFDLEAERRNRRKFVLIVIGFALLAVGGGTCSAYLLLRDEPPAPELTPPKPKPPEPIEEFVPIPIEPWPEERAPEPAPAPTPTVHRLPETVADSDLDRGLRRLQGAFDACAQTHGALDGTVVTLDFTIAESGRVDTSVTRPPHTTTPLGLCVADVLRSKGNFGRSRSGRRDIHRAVTLRR